MKSLKYLDWIRTKQCCVCGSHSEPHHEQAHRSKDYEKKFYKVAIINIVEGEKMDWDVNLLKVATLLLAEWTWSEFSGKRGYYW